MPLQVPMWLDSNKAAFHSMHTYRTCELEFDFETTTLPIIRGDYLNANPRYEYRKKLLYHLCGLFFSLYLSLKQQMVIRE